MRISHLNFIGDPYLYNSTKLIDEELFDVVSGFEMLNKKK